jgi:V/A-type H+-transporting ATPase subunit G/H
MLEALELIGAAEEEAHQAKLLAQQNAQKAIEEAEKAGESTVASTLARAESEIAHLMRVSDQKATQHAIELASKTANRQATLRARAERRLDTAAQLIVERIVRTSDG